MSALMEMVKGISKNMTSNHDSTKSTLEGMNAKLESTHAKLEGVMNEVSGIKVASEVMSKRVAQNEMDIVRVEKSIGEISMKMKNSPYIEWLREELNRTQKNVVIYNYTPPDNGLGLSRLDHINKLAPEPTLTANDIEVLGKEETGKKTPPILVKLGSFGARNRFLGGLKDKKQWLKAPMSINIDLPQVYRATYAQFRKKGKWHREFVKPDEAYFRIEFLDIEMQLLFQRRGYDQSVMDTFTPSEDNRTGRVTQSLKGPTPVPDATDIEMYSRTLILLGIGKGVEESALKQEILSITGVNEADLVLTFNPGVGSAKVVCRSFEILQMIEQKLKNEKNRKCFKNFQLY